MTPYLLQESLLTIRKERTSLKEMDMTEHTERKNREDASRERWAMPGEAVAPEGCSTEFLRQGYLHNPGGLLIDSFWLYNKIIYPPVFLIIQSTLIKCMYSWNIYEQLMMLLNCDVGEDS